MVVGERHEVVTEGFGEILDRKHRGGVLLAAVVRPALLLCAGLLAGALFGVWLMEHAFLGDGSFYTELKQLQIPAFTGPMSALGAGTVILALVYLFLVRRDRLAAGLTLAGALCFVVGFAITIFGHFPINARIMAWPVEGPPEQWSQLAADWRLAHDLRTLLGVVGFCVLLASASLPAGRKGSVRRERAGVESLRA
jgi:uncharacterized membrane protein